MFLAHRNVRSRVLPAREREAETIFQSKAAPLSLPPFSREKTRVYAKALARTIAQLSKALKQLTSCQA